VPTVLSCCTPTAEQSPGVLACPKARQTVPARRSSRHVKRGNLDRLDAARRQDRGPPACRQADGRPGVNPGLSGCSAPLWRCFCGNWPPHRRRRHSTRQQQSRQLSGYVSNSAFSDDRRHAAARAGPCGPRSAGRIETDGCRHGRAQYGAQGKGPLSGMLRSPRCRPPIPTPRSMPS
jgi:hypothetical protein